MSEQSAVSARDGYDLAVSIDEPDDESTATVVISAGVGFKQSFYGRYASYLADAGFRVIRYDYRGIGASAPASLRGFDADLTDWCFKDLNGIYDWVREEYASSPLVALGHSIGCMYIGLSDHGDALDASIFVTPPHAYWGHWPGFHKTWMAAVMYGLIPLSTRLSGYFPGRSLGFGENLPYGVALEWAKWCQSEDYLFDHFDDRTLSRYETLTAPSLSFSFTDDLYAPPDSVDAALAKYPNAPLRKREYDPGDLGLESVGHLGFFHDKVESSLWPESVDWLRETLSA